MPVLRFIIFIAVFALSARVASAQPADAGKPPVLISQVKLEYPAAAKEKLIEGKVTVALLIDTSGKVEEMKIHHSDNELLNAAAMTALKDARFIPASFEGVAERTWFLQTLTFRLSDEERAMAAKRVMNMPPVPLEPIGEYFPYPLDAKDAGIEGWVTVQMLIDTTGDVDSVEVLESSAPIFEQTSVMTMSRAKFTPALENGQKVRAWYKQSFKFDLPVKHVRLVAGRDTNITAFPVMLGEVPLFSSNEVTKRTETTMRVLVGSNGVIAAVIALDHNVSESIRSQITEIAYKLALAPGMIKDKVSEMWCDITFVVLPESK